jgi:hypothetical protein
MPEKHTIDIWLDEQIGYTLRVEWLCNAIDNKDYAYIVEYLKTAYDIGFDDGTHKT